MDPKNPLIIESHHPASFRERGVAVPFTTPLLAGARVRDTGRHGIEVLVPNPAGGRGVYILHCSSVQERYRPTVHDTVLLQRLSDIATLDPRSVRAAGWDVAREGLAGPEARAAAEAAAETDHSQDLLAEFQLLNVLAGQVAPQGLKLAGEADRSAALAHLRNEVLHRLTSSLGRPGLQLGATLAALADVFAPIGIRSDDPGPRVAQLISQLRDTHDKMVRSLEDSEETGGVRLRRSVIASMDVALACAAELLGASHALLADPVVLLKNWVAAPAQVTAVVTRTEWILDGWERIALLWRSARGNGERYGALLEMMHLVPVLPREALDWTQAALPPEPMEPACRVTCQSGGHSGRHSSRVASIKIGSNEKLRAMSL